MVRKFRKGFPKISLPEAIARTEQIYKTEHNHPSPREVIAKAMGYSGISGASSSTLSALITYGLLDHVSADEYRVSDDAMNMFLLDRGDPERRASVKSLALRPSIFEELNARFGTSASDRNLEAYLVKNDYNPDSARLIIKAYRETMEFLEDEAGRNGDSLQGDEPISSSPPELTESEFLGMVSKKTEPNVQLAGTTDEVLAFKLSQKSSARIVFSGKVTQRSIEKLISLLEISKDVYPIDSVD